MEVEQNFIKGGKWKENGEEGKPGRKVVKLSFTSWFTFSFFLLPFCFEKRLSGRYERESER